MKTSTIAVRVADFLKQHAPFDKMDTEDLLTVAASGRVKFHEAGELIFEEGTMRDPYLFVIQQGTVRRFKFGEKGEELLDVRTEGDLLGVSWLMGEPRYTNTAKADADTLLYGLSWDVFLPLARKYPAVGSYLAAYFSAHPGDLILPVRTEGRPGEVDAARESQDGWLEQAQPLDERIRRNLLSCIEKTTVSEAAKQMAHSSEEAIVVVGRSGQPKGIITETDLVRRVATGEVPLDACVTDLMSTPVVCVKPGLRVREILVLMMRCRLRHLCVTLDGTERTPVVGLIAERDLQLLHGRVPTALSKEIATAMDVSELRLLRQRVEELLLIFLETRTPVPWLSEFIAEVDHLITERALQLQQSEMRAEGLKDPGLSFCWLALGREGRRERFLRLSQKNALVYANPPVEQKEQAAAWFSRLADGVCMMLASIGYDAHGETLADNADWCKPVNQWRLSLNEWILNPVDNNILTKVPFFDFRPVAGNFKLAGQLRREIDKAVHRNPRFIPLLANDSLENLPPLTIFRDSVMDQAGVLWTCIDTKLHAMRPLADTARVLALQLGMLETTSTIERFRTAAQCLPKYKDLFEDAAEASRVALFYQTLHGLKNQDDGRYIRPAELAKIDHEKLKSVFRVVLRLLDFMRDYFRLEEEK